MLPSSKAARTVVLVVIAVLVLLLSDLSRHSASHDARSKDVAHSDAGEDAIGLPVGVGVGVGGGATAPALHRTTDASPVGGPNPNPPVQRDQPMGPLLSTSTSSCHASFHDFFVALLVRTAGSAIASAVYDANIFNTWSMHAASGRWDYEDTYWYTWGLDRGPVEPTHFGNLSAILWWNKRLMSVALSRVSRDSELSNLYVRSCKLGPLNTRIFERSVQRAIEAQYHYFHTVLQLAIDLLPASLKQTLHTMSARQDLYGVDPLVLLSSWITHSTTIADIEALLEVHAVPQLQATIVGQAQTHASPARRVVGMQPLFPLYYTDPSYAKSDPRDGKFWNMIRPTASCSSIVRLCEIADGCRFICNAEYLLHAGLPRTPMATATAATTQQHSFRHRIVGMGCNNDYEWEVSLLRLFDGARAAHEGADRVHQLGWVATMDCTLTLEKGKRQFNPPQALRSADIGFAAMSLCVDGKATAKHLTTLGAVKALMVKTSLEWVDGATSGRVSQYTASKAAQEAAKAHPGKEHLQWTTPPVAGAPSVRYFDGATVLKLDVEGYEHNVIPVWLREELASVGTAVRDAVAPDVTAPIDFEGAVRDYFSVSLLALEFHRIGHRHPHGSSEAGALRAHWFLLHVYALGYVMVAHEKNEMDQCCFEHAWVNTRHFIRSEMWMALREDM